jgi:hypothetical protein
MSPGASSHTGRPRGSASSPVERAGSATSTCKHTRCRAAMRTTTRSARLVTSTTFAMGVRQASHVGSVWTELQRRLHRTASATRRASASEPPQPRPHLIRRRLNPRAVPMWEVMQEDASGTRPRMGVTWYTRTSANGVRRAGRRRPRRRRRWQLGPRHRVL